MNSPRIPILQDDVSRHLYPMTPSAYPETNDTMQMNGLPIQNPIFKGASLLYFAHRNLFWLT